LSAVFKLPIPGNDAAQVQVISDLFRVSLKLGAMIASLLPEYCHAVNPYKLSVEFLFHAQLL
jgi:hypothetical protein